MKDVMELKGYREQILDDASEACSLVYQGLIALRPLLGRSVWLKTRGPLRDLDDDRAFAAVQRAQQFAGMRDSRWSIRLYRSAEPNEPLGIVQWRVGPVQGPSLSLQCSVQGSDRDVREIMLSTGLHFELDMISAAPGALAQPSGVGWLTFVRDSSLATRSDKRVESVQGGLVILAHQEGGASVSPAARHAIESVAQLLGRATHNDKSDDSEVSPKPTGLVSGTVERVALPSYLNTATAANNRSSEPPVHSPRVKEIHGSYENAEVNPDETLPIPSPYRVQPSLPFSGSTTPQRLAQLKASSPSMSDAERGEGVDETMMIRSPLRAEPAPGASFSEQISPVAIPVLSLDEYAKFRALLRVRGEYHVATWQRFGVLSKAAKDALQSRFAQYFQRDAQAQREFLALVDKYLKEQELDR